MADYLTFLPEKSPSRNIFVQIIFEILYALRFLLLYLPGLLMRPGDIAEGDKRAVVLVSGFLGSPLTWLKVRTTLAAEGHPVYVDIPSSFDGFDERDLVGGAALGADLRYRDQRGRNKPSLLERQCLDEHRR